MANPWISNPRDVELGSLITRRIRNKMGSTHVAVKDGQVTLSGTTGDFETKREILEEVREIGGVHGVTHHIEVIPIGGSEYE